MSTNADFLHSVRGGMVRGVGWRDGQGSHRALSHPGSLPSGQHALPGLQFPPL